MTTLGLVTVLFNSPDVLPEFFESLAAQTDSDWHLEVIDNSTDERSIKTARKCVATLGLNQVAFTRNTENVGVARANNQGITIYLRQNFEFVILLNNDICFGPHLLSQIREALVNGQDLVAPRVLYHDNGTIWYGGGRIRPIAATAEHYRDRQPVTEEDLQSRYTGYAPTCFMGINAKVFNRVGLMDERYFVYYDDTDFVYRCQKQGFRILYLGNAELRHKVSSSTGGSSTDFSIYYYNRNRLYFINKNLRGLELNAARAWYYFTRLIKYLTYSSGKRATLARAVFDGGKM